MKTTLKLLALSTLAVTAMAGCTGDSVQPTAAGSAYSEEDVVRHPTPGMVRPVGEFLASQGSYCMPDGQGGCITYAMPVQNHIAFYDEAKRKTIMVDYAGTTNMFMREKAGMDYRTTFSGDMREEPMPDGRSRVTVHYTGENALVYIVNGTDIANGPLFLGTRPNELMNPEKKGTTGYMELTVSYINQAPGMPVPDLMQLVRFPQPGQQLLETRFAFKGSGVNFSGQPTNFMIEQQGPVMPSMPGMDFRVSPPTAHATMTMY